MKEHFCPAEQSIITYQGECSWCGESEGGMTEDEIMSLWNEHADGMNGDTLIRFANAVAAKEREACAKVVDEVVPFGLELRLQKATIEDCAAAIRARGTSMTQEAMKLALGQLQAGFPGNAMQILREALAQTQEPVQFKCTVIDDVHPNGIPLEQWTSPPQRTWVDLTAEQMLECNMDGDWTTDRETAKLNVQAKLKELNT